MSTEQARNEVKMNAMEIPGPANTTFGDNRSAVANEIRLYTGKDYISLTSLEEFRALAMALVTESRETRMFYGDISSFGHSSQFSFLSASVPSAEDVAALSARHRHLQIQWLYTKPVDRLIGLIVASDGQIRAAASWVHGPQASDSP